ncbi:hypothetical protein Y032_0451g1686 [Ancylostoma ceylanicum]|uniref:Peptidase family M13 n=1 Tax=Ancylostoma ceylanicum TaxID=53326 RepID=A0A016WY34_9BILA|nr:hypothetical protein Y032_0451g1686 [Ancylostoma ceylanicum]
MPFGDPPDYVHLRTNESQMQLISMGDQPETPSGSPCFNTPSTREEPPAVVFIPGKGTARWWRGRTSLERILMSAVVLLVLLSAVLLAVILNMDRREFARLTSPSSEVPPESPSTAAPIPSSTTPSSEPPVCTTTGCVRAANAIINAMNTSVNPCEDFYEFACGAWNEYHPIPDDMSGFGTFSFVREQVRLQLRVLLEQEVTSESKSINMARIAYKTCMNKTQLDDLKTSLLFETLSELGYWPLIQNAWKRDNFNLTDLLALARRDYGAESFFQIYVYADAKNTSRNTLTVDQGTLSLGRGARDYYLNSTLFANHMVAYRKYFLEIVKILQEDAKVAHNSSAIGDSIDAVIAFEKKLAEIVVPEDERRNSTRLYNKRKIADLYNYMDDINWVIYFRQIAPSEMVGLFSNETEIIVAEIEYLEKASKLIKETDSELLANYIVWRVVQASVRLLDERFENIKQDFSRVMTGQQQRSPRWKDCAQVPSSVLPLAAGAVYVQAHFNSDDKREALEMIKKLLESFADLVSQNDWMDETTKKIAIEKANSMINNIGYPNITNDIKKLDEQYDELYILPEDTYYSLMKKAVIWMQKKEFRKLLKPFDRHDFEVSPAVVNAFYSPEKNAITFPAGILQPPFFSGSFPKAVNYGAIGAVIGHEITHGFDDQGSQYDKDGNLHNWWSARSLESFDERRRCIVEQYGNYTVPKINMKVNGKLTQGENIADNGGVKEAFKAYEKYVATEGEEPRLPGLQHYTNTQIFFLSYAHFWCGQKKEAAAVQQVMTDEHSPELFRVSGVLSNLREFAEAFSCPKGSSLNPEQRCVVW